jgi:hypothetical protein
MKKRVFEALKSLSENSSEANDIVNKLYVGPSDSFMRKKVNDLNTQVLALSLELGDELVTNEERELLERQFLKHLATVAKSEWFWRYDTDFFLQYSPAVRLILAKTLLKFASSEQSGTILQLWKDLCATNGEL